MVNTISERYADFATKLTYEMIPEPVRERACHLMLDAVGTGLAALNEVWGRRAADAALELGSGRSPVLGHGRRFAPRDAALVNGVLMHGLDFDDTHSRGVIHATVSSLPAALVMADKAGAGGRDFVVAYVLAMEISTRLASVAAGAYHTIGFHPTGHIGVFGATVAAGRLLGLSRQQMVMAQGIALSMASGSLEFLQDGAWTKRIHPGWAANCGFTAATLAKHDYVGPRAAYEGRFGLFSLYQRDAAPALLSEATAGLGENWEIDGVAVKPIPACHFTHAAADAAACLHADHKLGVADIKHVQVLVPEGVVQIVCEPIAPKRRPATSYDAQFSIPYIVATGLLKGRFTLAELEDEALTDRDVLELATRVDYALDPKSDYPAHYTGEVIVEKHDGSKVSAREAINRGAQDRPMTNAEIRAKFLANAMRVHDEGRAGAIADAVLNVAARPASALGDLLAREPERVTEEASA